MSGMLIGMLQHALAYAELGWRVVPVKQDTKRPRPKKWQDVATVDPGRITHWWDQWPDAGICLATGQESGVWVLDVDVMEGGLDTLRRLTSEHGELPKGPRADTGTNGFHLYFSNPEGMHVSTTKRIGGTGLDVRGDGGQVVLPPSGHAWNQCKVCADPERECPGQPYRWRRTPWDVELPEAPDWLLDLVVPGRLSVDTDGPTPTNTAQDPPSSRERKGAGTAGSGTPPPGRGSGEWADSAAEEVSKEHDWHTLLMADGWTLTSTDPDGDTQWTRPGKDERSGISAILHEPDGPFVNFSTNATDLCQDWARGDGDGWSYSIYGYLAATRFGGDRSAVAADWRRRQTEKLADDWVRTSGGAKPGDARAGSASSPGDLGDDDDAAWELELIDWANVHDDGNAFVEGLIFPGRWTAIAAEAKAGKTTLQVFMTVEISEGRSPFDGEHIDPVTVLYVDAEMGRLDLLERLVRMGHIDPTKLLNWYATDIPPRLDSPVGAGMLIDAVDKLGIQVVVIDGLNGVVSGAEKDDTVWREFYRLTVAPLKRRGVGILTGDNLGKDTDLGPRGSSVKVDKADAVLRLSRTNEGAALVASHRRSGQYVSELNLTLEGYSNDADTRRVRYTQSNRRGWSAGIPEAWAELVERELHEFTYSVAADICKREGQPLMRKKVFEEARRYGEAMARVEADRSALHDWDPDSPV